MSNLKVSQIDLTELPIDERSTETYGELNYIFYPGISASGVITIENLSASGITPELSFVSTDEDIMTETMRISGDNKVINLKTWSGTIAAGATEILYLYSRFTKEGLSGLYDETYWTNDGFTIADEGLINDQDEETAAIDADSADAGSTLTLDLGEGVTKEFVRLKLSVDATDPELTANIQYSDDNVTYTTVYTGADTSVCLRRRQITWQWKDPGEHRYWRIYKTNAATAGGNITEVQWLLFDAHDIDTNKIYGDHRCLLRDATGEMDDFEIRTSVMIPFDIFSRQNYTMPVFKAGEHTKRIAKNIEKHGSTIQLYYIPTMTFSYNLNAKADFQLEKRIWNTKCIVSPAKRNLRYIEATTPLSPTL